MNTSTLFNDVMVVLWDGEPTTKEAAAVAAYIKTHRVNAENAFEVLGIMWPDATFHLRGPGEAGVDAWYDVQFEDGSQVRVNAVRGIGSAIQMLS